MTRTVLRSTAVAVSLIISTAGLALGKEPKASRADDPARMALRYAEALANSRVAEWAALDLGCLARRRQPGASAQTNQACWDDTMKAHHALVADEPEKGIFGAMGRGVGFGLISETHRQADTWKDYPPGVFLSPAVVTETIPRLTVAKVSPTRRIAIQEKGKDPIAVKGTMVEIRVTYPDPLTAPLALKPGEIWWASGAIRRYGPVRDVAVQVVVVSELRRLGYASETAIANEALPDAPRIPGTRYGFDPDNIGRAFKRPGDPSTEPPVKGGLVLGSARWWTKAEAAERFRAGVERAKHLPGRDERLALMRRLLFLDPYDTEANLLLGNELFEAFLAEGLKKSGINAADEAAKRRLVELYWNIQAPTWRQELTAVSTGYEPAADALYGAIASLEIVNTGEADLETRRRLGALYRWNGDAESALVLHERLYQEASEGDRVPRGVFLTELAWDRIQWLAWNRRYDHPWMGQAAREAGQALELVEDPQDKLVAAQALLTLEALSLTRTPDRVQARVRLVKEWLDRIPLPIGVVGVWSHLVGNDLVKAFVPEGTQVTLPSPVRSPEVLDVAVHSNPPAQDLLRAWDFDHEPPGAVPRGLLIADPAGGNRGDWVVAVDPHAPTAPHVLAHTAVCPAADCVHVLLTEEDSLGYVDVTVQLSFGEGRQGRAGIAVGGQDGKAVYAATVNQEVTEVAIHRIEPGQITLLGTAAIKPWANVWHVLRIQRENYAHVSRPRLALFFDGAEALAVSDEPIPHGGRVGLVTMGTVAATFDGFHILKLVSNEPLSPAAAY